MQKTMRKSMSAAAMFAAFIAGIGGAVMHDTS